LVLAAAAYWSFSSLSSHRAAAAAREAAARLDAARQAQAAALVVAAERAIEAADLKTAGEKPAGLAELDAVRAADLRRQIERKAGARDTNQRYAEAKVERDQLLSVRVDPGQGFREKLKALEVRWTAAEAARQAQNWGEALSGYDLVLADCREITKGNTARGAASAKATAAKAAETESDAANASLDAKALYDEGGRASARAAIVDEANALKAEAESRLVPTLVVEALAGGVAVAATLSDGQRTWTTPATVKLAVGQRYNFSLSYAVPNTQYPIPNTGTPREIAPYGLPAVALAEAGATTNRRYKPGVLSLVADWRGARTERVVLEEQKEPPPGEEMTVDLGGGVKLTLCWCPSGSFLMGSPSDEVSRDSDETQHRVTLTKGFWMGKYEVTQGQWERVMGSTPSYFKGRDLPLETVSWDDCQEFVRKVNARVPGGGFRLPTEAEWEYACMAGPWSRRR
jgi:hypothetical protein